MAVFPTTRRNMIVRAAGSGPGESRAALEDLCSAYWEPLYRFARRRGSDADSARDEVQDFFARLLERGWIENVRADRGRFRSYLLAGFKHHVASLHDSLGPEVETPWAGPP
jgi:RNA polymerase sigma-70 factor (ECF subfamily)